MCSGESQKRFSIIPAISCIIYNIENMVCNILNSLAFTWIYNIDLITNDRMSKKLLFHNVVIYFTFTYLGKALISNLL